MTRKLISSKSSNPFIVSDKKLICLPLKKLSIQKCFLHWKNQRIFSVPEEYIVCHYRYNAVVAALPCRLHGFLYPECFKHWHCGKPGIHKHITSLYSGSERIPDKLDGSICFVHHTCLPDLCVFGISHFGLYYLYSSTTFYIHYPKMGKKIAAKVFNPNGFLTYYFINFS